jgi:hypothetical protein
MSYFAVCTFDLKGASIEHYRAAYTVLDAVGLKTTVTGQDGRIVRLPTTMTAGEFSGSDATSIRDDLSRWYPLPLRNWD